MAPFKSSNDTLEVMMDITPQAFDLDAHGHLSSHVWLDMEWTDHRLAWEPSEFGGIKSIRAESTDIWIPDIALYNRCD